MNVLNYTITFSYISNHQDDAGKEIVTYNKIRTISKKFPCNNVCHLTFTFKEEEPMLKFLQECEDSTLLEQLAACRCIGNSEVTLLIKMAGVDFCKKHPKYGKIYFN